MGYVQLLKWLWDSKLIVIAPGWAALLVIGYLWVFEIAEVKAEVTGVKDAVVALQISAIAERLDAAYAALCMNPGDPALLQRIRELQQEYEKLSDKRYPPPDCDLLLKLK